MLQCPSQEKRRQALLGSNLPRNILVSDAPGASLGDRLIGHRSHAFVNPYAVRPSETHPNSRLNPNTTGDKLSLSPWPLLLLSQNRFDLVDLDATFEVIPAEPDFALVFVVGVVLEPAVYYGVENLVAGPIVELQDE